MATFKPTVKVWPVYRRVPNTNPLARNAFDEVGDPMYWEVRGPLGLISRHKTEAKAEAVAADWQAYYDRCYPDGIEQIERKRDTQKN